MLKLKKFLYSTLVMGFVLFGTINVFADMPPTNNGEESITQQETTPPPTQASCQMQAEMNAQSVENIGGTYDEENESFLDIGPVGGETNTPSQDAPSSGPNLVSTQFASSQECDDWIREQNEAGNIATCEVIMEDGLAVVGEFLSGAPAYKKEDQI